MYMDSLITDVKGVGPAIAEKFAKLGVFTAGDLLAYFPRTYDDYSDVTPIADMMPGLVTLRVRFESISERRVKRGLHITQAVATDASGKVRVIWFNQPYRAANLTASEYMLRGKYEFKNSRLQIINPSVEQADSVRSDTTIVPTYPERAGLKNHQLRKIFSTLFTSSIDIQDTLPKDILDAYGLMPLTDAYKNVHIPTTTALLDAAKRRFAFEELFIVMMAAQTLKDVNKQAHALPIQFDEKAAKTFVSQLPFALTDDQRRVSWQILQDMQATTPMNRLVEGDVGSGKTVVAALASLMVLQNNMQAAFIAPTEILARQHFQTLQTLLAHTKYSKSIDLLVGSLKKTDKQKAKEKLASKQTALVVGTHALLEEDVSWHSLGLIVIDEQHRFGVKQRQKLQTKAGHMPHILSMTATPIPRSLALTVYGELDISIIKQKPANKAEITTEIVSPNSVQQMYDKVAESLRAGRQAYIVCPLITESEVLATASAEETYKLMRQKYLKDYRVGLLHGKLKPADKEAVMQQFKQHELDVIVSTTVIEVGVDVPNATEMVILGADRFGLAQLHQLRGRVGRGSHAAACYLVMSDSARPSKRMHAIASTSDGFELAEYDLELRGAGAIYGTEQHGALDLRYVRLSDHELIAEVRSAVNAHAKDTKFMVKYPYLAEKISKTLQLTYLN
jgi:ATP-dependent DNA helicase RecG